jgi:hypothetical protein
MAAAAPRRRRRIASVGIDVQMAFDDTPPPYDGEARKRRKSYAG